MDISKNLIMVMNNKTNKFEDKTKEIKWINDYKDTWKRKVTYTNEKTYTYNYNNIQWFKDPTEIDCKSNVVFYKGEPRNGALKILDFNEYIKIFFKKLNISRSSSHSNIICTIHSILSINKII